MFKSRNEGASWRAALKVAAIFPVASALWIVGSDALAARLAPTHEMLVTFQTYKGLVYTAVMSLLVFIAVKHFFQREQRVWAALRESEERYRNFVATSAEGIWCYKMEPPMPIDLPAEEQIQWALDHGRVEECNDVYARLYGFSSAADVVGLRFVDIVEPNEAIAREFLRAWLEGGYAFTAYEVAQLSRSGEEVWIHGSGVSVLEDGHVIRVWGTSIDITERRRTELALEASEAKYRRLVESLDRDYLIFSHGIDCVFTYVSPSIENVLGYTQDELATHYAETFVDSPGNAVAARHSEASIRGERQPPYEIEVRHKDGSTRQMEVIELPVFDEHGEVVAVEGIAKDITEQKKAEQILRASEKRYRTLFEAASDAVFVMEDDRFVECNSRTLEVFSCTWEQILHTTPVRFSPTQQPDGSDSREKTQELIAEAYAGRPQFFEWRHCRHDGCEFDAEVSLNRFELAGQYQLFAIVRDITERKKAEEAIAASERLYRTLFETAGDGLAILRLVEDGIRYMDCNARLTEIFRCRRDDILGRSPVDFSPDMQPDGRSSMEAAKEIVTAAFAGTPQFFEWQHCAKDGTPLQIEVSLNSVDIDGEQVMLAMNRDVTERKRADDALRESRTKLRAIFDHHYQLTGLLDPEGRLIAANRTALNFVGVEEAEVLGRFFWDGPWWDPSQGDRLRSAFGRAVQGEFVRFETTHLSASGDIRIMDFSLTPVRDDNGNIVYVVPEGRDITSMQKAEERLRETQQQLSHVSRLSTMGELVAGISHEVNQPLYAIRNFAEAVNNVLASEEEADLNELREWNLGISKAATHAAETVKRLRNFARRDESQRSFCSIDEILNESIQLVAFETRRRQIVVQQVRQGMSPVVHVDRVEIQQVLVNLLQNACEATDEGGVGAREITIGTEIVGEFLDISVADNGPGLPSEGDLPILEAFVTTKQDGLGIGLAIATTIVEAHGGKLWAASKRDGGATFHFTLPVMQEAHSDGR